MKLETDTAFLQVVSDNQELHDKAYPSEKPKKEKGFISKFTSQSYLVFFNFHIPFNGNKFGSIFVFLWSSPATCFQERQGGSQ